MAITFFKVDINFFQNAKIQRITRMPGGDTYIKIYFALLSMAMKSSTPGLIMISDTLAADPADIAQFCSAKEDEVKAAISVFQKLSMVEIHDGVVLIPSFEEHQKLDKVRQINESAKERMRKYREKQRLQIGVTRNDTRTLHESYDTDLDLDLDSRHKTKTKKKKEREEGEAPAPKGALSQPLSQSDFKSESEDQETPGSGDPLIAKVETLFDRVYSILKQLDNLPTPGTDGVRTLYGKAARKSFEAIESADGLDYASEIFCFAAQHKFWKTIPLSPRHYDKYKIAWKEEVKKHKPNELSEKDIAEIIKNAKEH